MQCRAIYSNHFAFSLLFFPKILLTNRCSSKKFFYPDFFLCSASEQHFPASNIPKVINVAANLLSRNESAEFLQGILSTSPTVLSKLVSPQNARLDFIILGILLPYATQLLLWYIVFSVNVFEFTGNFSNKH